MHGWKHFKWYYLKFCFYMPMNIQAADFKVNTAEQGWKHVCLIGGCTALIPCGVSARILCWSLQKDQVPDWSAIVSRTFLNAICASSVQSKGGFFFFFCLFVKEVLWETWQTWGCSRLLGVYSRLVQRLIRRQTFRSGAFLGIRTEM